jgi:hypothetical protein
MTAVQDEQGVDLTLTPEQIAQDTEKADAAELASFEAEIDGKDFEDADANTPVITETPVETPVTTVVEESAPKMAQITEEQLARILTYSNDIDAIKTAMESRFGTAFGKLGSLAQTLKELQIAADPGEAITVSEDDLSELKNDYPDLTPAIAKSLTRVLSKVKGGRIGQIVAKEFDPATLEPTINEKAQEIAKRVVMEEQIKDLADDYPDWEKIIGPQPDPTKGVKPTEFRNWLASQPAEYQKRVNTSQRAVVGAKALGKFEEWKETKKKSAQETPKKTAADIRREQLKDSVTERGNASQHTAKSEEDAFHEHLEKVGVSS